VDRFTEAAAGCLKSLCFTASTASWIGARRQACLELKLADPSERLAEHPPRFAQGQAPISRRLVRRCLMTGTTCVRSGHAGAIGQQAQGWGDTSIWIITATLEGHVAGFAQPACLWTRLWEIERITVGRKTRPTTPRHSLSTCLHLIQRGAGGDQRHRPRTNSSGDCWSGTIINKLH